MGKPTADNPAYEYASAHASVEPDIYLDDEPDEVRNSAPLENVRIIFATCLQAAAGDLKKLHSIMGTLAGLPLREVGRLSGISHEGVRIHLKSLEHSHPELFKALIRRGRLRVDSLVPILSTSRWRLTPATGKPLYVSNLFAYCEQMGWPYKTVQSRFKRGHRHAGYKIERLHVRAKQEKAPNE